MLLNPITIANRVPEKLMLIFKCVLIIIFLIILYLSTDKPTDNVIAIPAKGLIQAPMKNTGSGSLRTTHQASSVQRSTHFIAGNSR